MKTKLLLTVLFSIGIIGITNAQTGQERRIHQGERSGQLTRVETAKLQHEQFQTHRYINHAKANGVITRHEGKVIRHDERRNNRDIYRLKHNNRTRRF